MQHPVVYFYKIGENIPYDCFSQWYYSPIVDNKGITYQSIEQYLMAQKAMIFGDDVTYRQIMASDNPSTIRDMGRRIKGYSDEVWRANRYVIAITGNYLKFYQHEDLRMVLLSTGNRGIAEASPRDGVWGIGIPSDVATKLGRRGWKGSNLLGSVLMTVRTMLREHS